MMAHTTYLEQEDQHAPVTGGNRFETDSRSVPAAVDEDGYAVLAGLAVGNDKLDDHPTTTGRNI